MKTHVVAVATAAANAIAVALADEATTPVAVTVAYIDADGRAVTARHVVGVPGWMVEASARK